MNRYNYFIGDRLVEGYPQERRVELKAALMEAWVWLEREGLIIPKPGTQGEWCVLSRRAQRLGSAAEVAAFRHSNLLPKAQLHPAIAQKVWSMFVRGGYDTAVFQAFKEVEVAARIAGEFGNDCYGIDLMRRAFHPEGGPLTDKESPKAEREALMHLFSGAIGVFKNPQSHRDVMLDRPIEAVESIVFASSLLRIVDARVEMLRSDVSAN